MPKTSFKSTLPLIALGFFMATISSPAKTQAEQTKYEFFSSSRGPAPLHERAARKGTVLYKIKENATESEKQRLTKVLDLFDVKAKKKLIQGKVDFAQTERTDIAESEIAEAIAETGAVEFAEPDSIVELAYVPNDPEISTQWHHTRVHSFNAWNTTLGRKTVVVAMCDTGVEASHPDLRKNLILPGYNAEDGTTNTSPVQPHGTLTTGTVAAIAGNRKGVAGVAPQVKILPIRVSNIESGASSFSTLANCIRYAADHGAKVVNVSYSGADSYTIDEAAQYLRGKGGLLVMAAGNEAMDTSIYSDFSSFVIVGATDQADQLAWFSNYGLPTDIVAPGVDIYTTNVGGSYASASGTSLAAPVVAGVAALIYSVNPNLSPTRVEDILLTSATPLGSGPDDLVFGHGIVDAAAAVAKAKATLRTRLKN